MIEVHDKLRRDMHAACRWGSCVVMADLTNNPANAGVDRKRRIWRLLDAGRLTPDRATVKLLGRPSLRLARSDLALRGRSRPRALGALAALALAAAPTLLAPTLASADPTCTT